jgi:hypothetical protein
MKLFLKKNFKTIYLLFLGFSLFVFTFHFIFAQTTYYIGDGSMADSVEYFGGDELRVRGIPPGGFFEIKTTSQTVLKVNPSLGAGFDVLNSHFSGGSLSQFEVYDTATAEDVNYIVGVPTANKHYKVKLDGVEIENSPYKALGNELTFSNDENGVYTFEETTVPCASTDVRGYARAEDGTWISFSCLEQYEIGEEGSIHYGVDIDEVTGLLSGQAWSDTGWITFTESHLTGCPAAPCHAKLLANNKLEGWGRTETGWVQLTGAVDGEVDPDEAEVELIGNDFYGWAYDSGDFGWISFNCETEGTCGETEYRVYLTAGAVYTGDSPVIRTRPAKRTASAEGTSAYLVGELLYLGSDSSRDVWFRWGDSVADDGEGNDQIVDYVETGPVQTLTSTGIFSERIDFAESFGETYYFRAVVEDEEDVVEGNILSFLVTKGEGTITVTYGDKEKSIFIGEEGSIEIIR